MHDVPKLVDEMLIPKSEDQGTAAAKGLYFLCDVAHKENRVPLVCSGNYEVLIPLTKLLVAKDQPPNKLRYVILTLNNVGTYKNTQCETTGFCLGPCVRISYNQLKACNSR